MLSRMPVRGRRLFQAAAQSRGLTQSGPWQSFNSLGQCSPVRIPRPFPLNPTERRVINFFIQLQRDNPEGLKGLEYRMAGGWVRDKLLRCPEFLRTLGGGRDGRRLPQPPPTQEDPNNSGDIDIALSTMTGAQLLPYVEAAQDRSMDVDAIGFVAGCLKILSPSLGVVVVG